MVDPDSKKSILLVDDNADLQLVMEFSLSYHGYDVRCAGSCRSAIEAIQEAIPDIAIIDYGLPDENGAQLGKQIRELDGTEKVKLVLFSGIENTQIKIDALADGFDAFLPKPIEMDELLEKIEQLIS